MKPIILNELKWHENIFIEGEWRVEQTIAVFTQHVVSIEPARCCAYKVRLSDETQFYTDEQGLTKIIGKVKL